MLTNFSYLKDKLILYFLKLDYPLKISQLRTVLIILTPYYILDFAVVAKHPVKRVHTKIRHKNFGLKLFFTMKILYQCTLTASISIKRL